MKIDKKLLSICGGALATLLFTGSTYWFYSEASEKSEILNKQITEKEEVLKRLKTCESEKEDLEDVNLRLESEIGTLIKQKEELELKIKSTGESPKNTSHKSIETQTEFVSGEMTNNEMEMTNNELKEINEQLEKKVDESNTIINGLKTELEQLKNIIAANNNIQPGDLQDIITRMNQVETEKAQLQNEKMNAQKELEEYRTKNIADTNMKISELTKENIKLKEEINKLNEANVESLKPESMRYFLEYDESESTKVLKKEIEEVVRENKTYKSMNNLLSRQIKSLKSTIELENVNKMKLANEIKEYKKEIKELRLEIDRLRNELKTTIYNLEKSEKERMQTTNNYAYQKDINNTLLKEVNDLKKYKAEVNKEYNEQVNIISKLEKTIKEKEVQISKLKNELLTLKNKGSESAQSSKPIKD